MSVIILLLLILTSCIHQTFYRLESIEAKLLHEYHDGGYCIYRYGITDKGVTTFDDTVSKFAVTNWDSRYDKKDYVCLKKIINSDNNKLDYTIKIFRPYNSEPWELKTMGVNDQGEYIEMEYIIDRRSGKSISDNSKSVLTSNDNGKPTSTSEIKIDQMALQKPNPSQNTLIEMLSRIDRIRVMSAGMEDGKLAVLSKNQNHKVKVLIDTRDPDQIASFRAYFSILEDTNTFGYCACLGWPTFEFLSGTQLVARIGLHHGRSIRWNQWNNDAILLKNEQMLNWLAVNGAPQPKKEYEKDIKRQADMKKQHELWLIAAPDSIRAEVRDFDIDPFATNTTSTIDTLFKKLSLASSPKDQALSLFTWHGSGCGKWSGYPSYEELPEIILMRIPTPVLLQAMTNKLSDVQREGISRFFTSPEFNRERYKDRKLLSEKIKQSIRDHVYKQKDNFKIKQMNYYLSEDL